MAARVSLALKPGVALKIGVKRGYGQAMDQRQLFKVLADDTRWTLFSILNESDRGWSVQELADKVCLHPNSVRPHLDQMRESGLVVLEAHHTGQPGRPLHRYRANPQAIMSVWPEAPIGTLASVLADLADSHGIDGDAARAAGRDLIEGLEPAQGVSGFTKALEQVGFHTVVREGEAGTVVGFVSCPYRPVADEHAELVCGIHQGLCDALAEGSGLRIIDAGQLVLEADTVCEVCVAPDETQSVTILEKIAT